MKGISPRRVLTSLQMVSMAILVGVSLYIYNDWRIHRSSAAPLLPVQSGQSGGSGTKSNVHPSEESPLDLGDQGVSGTVEVGPDGTIHPTDGSPAVQAQPAMKP